MSYAPLPELDPNLLAEVQLLADEQGRAVHDLLNEAVAEYLTAHSDEQVRSRVMAAHAESHAHYASVYRRLAE
jgi:predicted transcriptional regulator